MSQASQFLVQRLSDEPDNWQLRRLAAEALATEGSDREAASLVAETPTVPTTEGDLFFSIDLLASQDPEQASAFANQVIEADKENPVSYVGKAYASWLGGDEETSRAWYQQAQALQPGYQSELFEKTVATDSPNQPADQPFHETVPVDSGATNGDTESEHENIPVAVPVAAPVAAPLAHALPAPSTPAASSSGGSIDNPQAGKSPEENAHLAELASRKNRKKATQEKITATLVTLVVHAVILALLAIVIIAPALMPAPEIVAITAPSEAETELETREIAPTKRQTPAAPSQAAAQVLSAVAPSPTAISTVDFQPDTEVVDLGSDFGAGFGFGGTAGVGMGASFFNQTGSGKHFAFVIDYSASMRGRRDSLMREELTKTVSMLKPGVDYQLIFFAGPAWVAGNKVSINKRRTAVVKSDGDTYDWKTTGGAHGWVQEGEKQVPTWVLSTRSNIKRSLDHIEETRLVWGTIWGGPLKMALSMSPPPDVIFFMTDGSIGNAEKELDEIISLAKRSDTQINTIAMMQPRAKSSMKKLAEETGGQFSLVNADGSTSD